VKTEFLILLYVLFQILMFVAIRGWIAKGGPDARSSGNFDKWGRSCPCDGDIVEEDRLGES